MNRRHYWSGLALGILMLLTGCSLAGHYTSRSLDPDMARKEFKLLGTGAMGPEFTKAAITLNPNKTFSAEVYYGENLEQDTGSWQYSDGKLTLTDSKGVSQTYTIDLSGDGKTLKMVRTIRGTDVVLIMVRTS